MYKKSWKHCKLVLPIVFMLASASSSAQQAVVAAGGEASGSGGSMSFSVGLCDYLFYSSEAGSMQLGIQHASTPKDEPGVPVTRHLETSDVNQASDNCFDATTTITTAGPGLEFVVETGTSVVLVAGQSILMLPGTRVLPGGYLHAWITTEDEFCSLYERSSSLIPLAEDPASATFNPAGALVNEVDALVQKPLTIKVYPNPTTADFTIEIFSGQQADADYLLEIIGMRGELVYSQESLFGSYHEISLAGHPAGLYLLRVTDGKQVAFHRIIKR